ncbi:MAG TPA: transaldolase [Actinomycetes bacterium]|nr:transaldolase [Actinomycetes bacterium]
MTRLHQLHDLHGQSPWLDNLTRGDVTGGRLRRLIDQGIRGVTSNPTIIARAVSGSTDYDGQLALTAAGQDAEASYWSLVTSDLNGALAVLRPTYDRSGGRDGFVSVELAPALAHHTQASVQAARVLHQRIPEPNLLVKIPATAEGVPAIGQATAEGLSINVTLLFGLDRHEQVIEAYLQGLEAHDGDLSRVHGVASFFVSRVDTEVDRRLEAIGTPAALALRGQAAVAQAKLAYRLFQDRFSGPRWQALAARGARPQRPLWASTSTKNRAYPDTLYVDGLIGPDTVTTLPEATIAAFEDHGALAATLTQGVQDAQATLERLGAAGIDLDEVAGVLEAEGVAAFATSYDQLLSLLQARAAEVTAA